ncbi:cytochrome c oxidase subunit II [Sanguibacter sp. HDW7]|nr:cytochrome c oxidase subunit II [Sanguibacter sp. HDW7]
MRTKVPVACPPPGRDVKGPPLHSQTPPSRSRRTRIGAISLSVLVVLALSGCSEEAQRGFLPGYSDGPVTNHTDRITNMWVGSWAALLVVGLITWGLMLWCVVAYRKRKDDHQLPVQTRYHIPLEMMYTAIPIIMIGVLFYFTQRDMAEIRDTSDTPDVTIQVVGKQWSWDFNYLDDDVYESGVHASDVSKLGGTTSLDGAVGTDESLPTLYLPVGEKVELILDSRDVIHSFWVPAFLDKLDMIPHRTNKMHVTPERIGFYAGKCAELCGEHHSGMLFNVAIVPRAEYDAAMEALRAKGQTGALGMDLVRQQDDANLSSTEGEK